jgi:hypothetical protein
MTDDIKLLPLPPHWRTTKQLDASVNICQYVAVGLAVRQRVSA